MLVAKIGAVLSGPAADALRRLARSGDLVLAGVLVAIVCMMVVPLPTLALDCLIAANLAFSLGLLIVALYVAEASRLAALPALLLLATLFRLGLNVSTTRLVLLEGDAGRIVEAFGRVVVAGNVVVGGAVFLVLAVVQFVVIAKGSERVAEVAARFTLDALPGKQMSIDADLRAGAVSLEEAQARRRELERESQLYGALDGAMKFVKGDAIAGLVILAVNIAGGFAVGVLQRGMTLSAAASHYTVLTVGDGLVAQLPSLFLSTTAGLIVTRVPDEGGENLGAEIGAQLAAQPRALAITGALVAAIALVPGLPALPFLALGALAAAAGLARRRAAGTTGARQRARESDLREITLANATPLELRLGAAAREAACGPAAAEPVDRIVGRMRVRLFGRLGLRVPELQVVDDDELDPLAFEIARGGCVWLRRELPPEPRWVEARADELRPIGAGARDRGDAGLVWTDAAGAVRAETAGYRAGDRAAYLGLLLERAITENAAEFVGIQEARELADALEATHPALVGEVLPRAVSLAQLADVLRRLVDERVSIRDLKAIFEAIAAHGAEERDVVALVERVRASLRRQLSVDAAGGAPSLPVYVLAPAAESAFRAAARYAAAGGPVPLDPEVGRALVEGLRRLEAAPRERAAPRPVLLVAAEIRRHVRAVVEGDLPELRVLSFQELLPSIVLQPIAAVGEVARATLRTGAESDRLGADGARRGAAAD